MLCRAGQTVPILGERIILLVYDTTGSLQSRHALPFYIHLEWYEQAYERQHTNCSSQAHTICPYLKIAGYRRRFAWFADQLQQC